MSLGELLGKMRLADKITVFREGQSLFCGEVNKGWITMAGMMDEEVEKLYPELLNGLYIYLKEDETSG